MHRKGLDIEIFNNLMTQKTVPEAMDMLADGTKADGYNGVGFNLVLADSKNNIGY